MKVLAWAFTASLFALLVLPACQEGSGERAVQRSEPQAVESTPTPSRPAGDAVTPSPLAQGEPAGPGGREVVQLTLSPEMPLPREWGLIVEAGCWNYDGPTTDLVRVYRAPDGEVRRESLVRRDDGAFPKVPGLSDTSITGFAVSPGSDRIDIDACRGFCGPLGGPGPEAHTMLWESSNGGV